jgi:two-component system, LytTR family, response regulator
VDNLKILVVEDEVVVSMMISDILENIGYSVLPPVNNYESAVKSIMENGPDLVLLDIIIKGTKNGIDVAKFIKETIDIPFIFLTQQADERTVEQAKKLNPPAYLVKPFNKDDLFTSIELAMHNFKSLSSSKTNEDSANIQIKDAFFIKDDGFFRKVKFSDILFVKSDHIYIELYTLNGKKYLVRSTMEKINENLPSDFLRIHRSYIINLHCIDAVNMLYVMINGTEIPIGKNYRNQLKKSIQLI